VVFGLLLVAAPAAATGVGGFKTGATLWQLYEKGPAGRAEQRAYVVGVLDAERIVAAFAGFRSPICLPPGLDPVALGVRVHEWLGRHRERLDQQAANLVLVATKESYPCPR
jgi:hypothetical protein